MKKLLLVISLVFLATCKSAEPPVTVPEKIAACSSFNSTEECVMAKEINFTLAYYLSSKDASVFSMSQEATKPQFTKLKSSKDLEDLKKKINDEKYVTPNSNLGMPDIIQYIQDEKEGLSSGKSALEVKKERQLAMQEGESRKRGDDSQVNKKLREKMEKDIEANPYLFEVSCSTFDESRIELDICVNKLKPNLKITSDKKVIYSFSQNDFSNGAVNSQVKLPKDFNVELTSSGQDSSKLLVVMIKNRIIKEDSGKLVYSVGKVFTKVGQNLTIIP